MMSVEEIKNALHDRRPGIVANATGLHYNTIRDIRDGRCADPKHQTVKILSAYLQGTLKPEDVKF